MELHTFINSLNDNDPPQNVSMHLKALWYDAKGNWGAAHDLVQDLNDATSAWIHAYLHRKEGDNWNAGYWYKKANQPFPYCGFSEEWNNLLENLL